MASTRRKTPLAKIAAPHDQVSTKATTKVTIDELRTVVSSTDTTTHKKILTVDPIEISDDEESFDSDSDMPDADAPTFGELATLVDPVDVSAALATTNAPTTTTVIRTITAPSLGSLSTVLTQALKTDDAELLESCLTTANVTVVRSTIERLDSALAGALLSKLAVRIHRRPGRAGTLLQWVQWTLVAHGGALASQPEVTEKLVILQKVLMERSRGLNSLLILKGKLDLLESQMQLRKRMQSKESRRDGVDDGEGESVIWVEGHDKDAAHGAVDDDEDADEVPMTNGILGDSDEEDNSDDVNLDSEDDDADDNDDDVNHSDVEESGDEDDSDAEAVPPSKMRKTGNGFSKSR